MQHATEPVLGLLVALFGLVVTAIAVIEHAARQGLAAIGIGGPPQTVSLVLLLVALIIAAVRAVGRVFAILIALALILILVHAMLGGGGPATVNV